jgi:hypothetical protein
VFPYNIGGRYTFELYDVIWNDINPYDWPTGEYFMEIHTQDWFGYEARAIVSKPIKAKIWDKTYEPNFIWPNPWRVKVFTGN